MVPNASVVTRSAALDGVEMSELMLPDSNTESRVGIWPSDIGSLAFELDEFFDALDGLFLHGDVKQPTMNDSLGL